jgi:hypothetical protein
MVLALSPLWESTIVQDRWLSKVSEGLDFVLKPIAQVLDITAEPAGLDPTGALKSGCLILHSFAYACKMTALGGFKEPRTGMLLWIDNDINFGGSSDVVPMPYRAKLDYQPNTLPEDTWVQALNESGLQEVFCVLISRTPGTNGDYDNVFGLVLSAVELSVYERIGTFECFADKSRLPWPGFKLQEITII